MPLSPTRGYRGRTSLPRPSPAPAQTRRSPSLSVAEDFDSEDEGPPADAAPGVKSQWETLFGLQKGRGQPTGNHGKYDYMGKYPEDAQYEEASPNARVWRTYLDECAVFDAEMIGESRDALDVLLVFAGLFSAVLTTFVAQTSQDLQPDFAEVSSNVLLELVALQRAQANGTSLDSISPASTAFVADDGDVWVNGLWFTSLALSLATALFAVVVKQWLRQYMSTLSGTPRERCHLRHYRFIGLREWHVLTIIGLLPVIMHIALGVFMTGLTVFLVPRRLALAWIVGAITCISFGLYFVTNMLPLFDIHCPYRTPLSDAISVAVFEIEVLGTRLLSRMRFAHRALHPLVDAVLPGKYQNHQQDDSEVVPDSHQYVTLKDREAEAVTKNFDDLSVQSVKWLFTMSSNPTVRNIVLEAISGLPLSCSSALEVSFQGDEPMRQFMYTTLHKTTEYDAEGDGSAPTLDTEASVERVLRAALHVDWMRRTLPILSSKLIPSPHTVGIPSIHAVVYYCCEDASRSAIADAILPLVAEGSPSFGNVTLPPVIWKHLFAGAYQEGHAILPGYEWELPAHILSHARTTIGSNPSDVSKDKHVLTFREAIIHAGQDFLWDLFWRFDLHIEAPLDNKTLQHVLAASNYCLSMLQAESEHQREINVEGPNALLLFSLWSHISGSFRGAPATDRNRSAIQSAAEQVIRAAQIFPMRGHLALSVWRAVTSSYSWCLETLPAFEAGCALRNMEDSLSELLPAFVEWKVEDGRVLFSGLANLGELWTMALRHNVDMAFLLFRRINLLRFLCASLEDSPDISPRRNYIQIATERPMSVLSLALQVTASTPIPHRTAPQRDFVDYLFALPARLFATCQILTLRDVSTRFIQQDIVHLAQMRPEAREWQNCIRWLTAMVEATSSESAWELYVQRARQSREEGGQSVPIAQGPYQYDDVVAKWKPGIVVAVKTLNEFFAEANKSNKRGGIAWYRLRALHPGHRRFHDPENHPRSSMDLSPIEFATILPMHEQPSC